MYAAATYTGCGRFGRRHGTWFRHERTRPALAGFRDLSDDLHHLRASGFLESNGGGQFWTDQSEAYARLQSVDMLRRAQVVVKTDREGLVSLMNAVQWTSAEVFGACFKVEEACDHWMILPRGEG